MPVLTFKPTGPVVLLNHEPWGSVDVNLYENEVQNLDTITGDDFTFDEATGAFTGTIRFPELKYSGKYTLRRGRASASAMRTAFESLRSDAGASGEPGDDSNIAAAKAYQNQLTTSDSGRFMLSTYYQYNDAYSQCYQNSKYVARWQNYQTNGKTTAVFAKQTAGAANNPGGPPVNGDPDYNPHAFFMNTLVVATCNAQQNADAANAASEFQSNSGPTVSATPNVNGVMNKVNTSQPPSTVLLRKGAVPPADLIISPYLDTQMRDDLAIAIAEIEKEEEDVRAGVLLRENTGRPIDGEFLSYFGTQPLTVSGTITQDAGGPKVTLASVSGAPPEVRVKLGAFPGNLHAEVDNALERANFLKGVLGQRVLAALNESSFLAYLGALLTAAIKSNA
ncbi:MAG TPA: hypothetical protein VM733_09410 [Thermoanaerobaculia bacterium]|nr:hypothetical protein [Thermoanaerobaculia bacterium]